MNDAEAKHNRVRKLTRVVAIVDLILTSLTLWVPLLMLSLAIKSSKNDMDNAIYWILFGLSFIMVTLELWAAIKLVNATQIGKQPREAATLARFWRSVTIMFTIITVLSVLRNSSADISMLASILHLCIRFGSIYVVHSFIYSADMMSRTTLPMRIPQDDNNGFAEGYVYTYMTTTVPNTTPAEQYENDLPPKYEDVTQNLKL